MACEGSVSSPRPSNRACASRAHGLPTSFTGWRAPPPCARFQTGERLRAWRTTRRRGACPTFCPGCRARLLRAGVQASMGSVGDSYDNALAENLWMIIKTECIRGRVFASRAEANLALFEYIDGFYNSRRIQKRLGYLSPIEFEEKYYADQATAERTNLKPRQPLLTS
ncbi:IS3 family transposase [Streptomyces sp. NBC_01320]|uniref:IS3 family transposase n=1 Tax=Streptomyces sp. NBC_01320 TaxID=2903824 RepID=UPI002E0D178E|nr:IS3 family transposase [Streptomyces sp. NBC_01320]